MALRTVALGSAAILALTVGVGGIVVSHGQHRWAAEQRERARQTAAAAAFALEQQLSGSLSSTYTLAALVMRDERVKGFDELAARIFPHFGGMASLQLAPGAVISRVYPLAGNEAAMGRDLLRDPDPRFEASDAVKSRKLTVAGPFELRQGGVGLVGRLAVFLPDDAAPGGERFWGLVTAVLRVKPLLDAAQLARLEQAGYRYQLTWRDPEHGRPPECFAGCDAPLDAPVAHDVSLPNGRWTLLVSPRGGWPPPPWRAAAWLLVCAVAAATTLLSFDFLRRPGLLRREVEARTAELRRANEQLVISEREKALVLDSSADCIVFLDPERRIQWTNRRAADRAGTTVEKLRGRYCWEAFHGRGDPCPGCPVALAIADGEPRSAELSRGDDSTRFAGTTLFHRAHTLRDDDGRLLGAVEFVEDITGRKRTEEALLESEARFRTLADNIPQNAHMFDPQGQLTWENRRSLEFYGGSVKGAAYLDAIHPDDRERVSAQMKRCLATGEAFEGTFRLRDRTGVHRWFLTRIVALQDRAGAIVRWFGTSTDVTELRNAQDALREADRRKTEFLAVLSHELRNPLAPIRSSLHLLHEVSLDTGQAKRALDVIERQTQHLTRLVDDLLDATRVSHGKFELEREPLDVRDLIRRTCDDLGDVFAQRGVSLRVDAPGALWVEADSVRLAQAVGNLLQNSAKFTPRGGHACVSLSAEGGRAVIRVRDDGAGMEPTEVERMFEPFTQADGDLARRHGGLGLGLAVVRRVAEMHGGSVVGRSDGLGRGSEFTITLPRCTPPVAKEAHPAAAPAPISRHVLIIEDNVDAGESLAEVLRVSGHRVCLALDGRTGIAEARRLAPDVVLCDIGLPDVNGYEVARVLRADPALGSTRLIALTGYAQPDDRERAREAGFDAHLAKPASMQDIEQAIAQA